jgi:hypothetical protein
MTTAVIITFAQKERAIITNSMIAPEVVPLMMYWLEAIWV